MGGFPALAVQPPPDPTQGLERAVTLRNLIQNAPVQRQILQQQAQSGALNVQEQQLNLKSQQAMMRAYTEANGDPDKTVSLSAKYGALPKDTLALQQHFLQQRAMTLDLVSKQGAEAKRQAELMQGAHDQVAASDNKPVAYANALQSLTKQGVDTSQMPPQYPGDDAFKTIGAAVQSHTQMVEDALKQAETREKSSSAAAKEQEAQFYKQNPTAGAPGVPPETVQMMDFLRKNPGKTPSDYAAAKAEAVSRAEAPVKIATAEAEGRARANIEQEAATRGNAQLKNVPTRLVQAATTAADKADQDYAQAKSVSDRIAAIMDSAKRGNVVSYQLLPQEGALQVTTSQGVHRINMAEIQNYGGGSLWQRMEGHIGKQLTGRGIADSVLKDMGEMQSLMAKGSKEKYHNTLKSINKRFSSTFDPVEMEGLEGGTKQTGDFFGQFGGKAKQQ